MLKTQKKIVEYCFERSLEFKVSYGRDGALETTFIIGSPEKGYYGKRMSAAEFDYLKGVGADVAEILIDEYENAITKLKHGAEGKEKK